MALLLVVAVVLVVAVAALLLARRNDRRRAERLTHGGHEVSSPISEEAEFRNWQGQAGPYL